MNTAGTPLKTRGTGTEEHPDSGAAPGAPHRQAAPAAHPSPAAGSGLPAAGSLSTELRGGDGGVPSLLFSSLFFPSPPLAAGWRQRTLPGRPLAAGARHGARLSSLSRLSALNRRLPAAGAAVGRRPGAAVARSRLPGRVPGAERQLGAAGAGPLLLLGPQPTGEAPAAGGSRGAAGG